VPQIDAELLKALTPMAVLLLIVLLIVIAFIRGWIRTAVAIKEVREDRDARLADKDRQIEQWREAHRVSEEARELDATASREQLEQARMTLEIVRAIRAATDRRSNEGGT
jgi:hypothetical protein